MFRAIGGGLVQLILPARDIFNFTTCDCLDVSTLQHIQLLTLTCSHCPGPISLSFPQVARASQHSQQDHCSYTEADISCSPQAAFPALKALQLHVKDTHLYQIAGLTSQNGGHLRTTEIRQHSSRMDRQPQHRVCAAEAVPADQYHLHDW